MKPQRKTGTLSKKGVFWKVANSTAYPGLWVIGSRNPKTKGAIKTVPLYPIPFSFGKLWLKKRFKHRSDNKPIWRKGALKAIIANPNMLISIEWLSSEDGSTVYRSFFRSYSELLNQYKHPPENDLFPRIVVVSRTDGSEIGDPDFAMWLIRNDVRPVCAHRNRTTNMGCIRDKKHNTIGYACWDEYRNLDIVVIGDTYGDNQLVSSLNMAKAIIIHKLHTN